MNKALQTDDYINFLPLLSYNALWYFLNTVRNIGKTWSIERMAWRRAEKKGKKCIYVRRFKKEANESAQAFYSSSDLLKFCGNITEYDPATKKGNFKRKGKTFYIKRNKKWTWFLKIMSLAEFRKMRSSDDVDCDLIFYDEYTTTPRELNRYFGNEVEDFIDLTISICRQHPIRVIFCGNNESVVNPYFNYFKIPELPRKFEGVKKYRSGTIIVYQRNTPTKQSKQSQFMKKLQTMLKDTAYGAFLFDGANKQQLARKWYKVPREAITYINFKWKAKYIRVSTHAGFYYVDNRVNVREYVFVDEIDDTSDKQYQLNKSADKAFFKPLIMAISNNIVRYESESVYREFQPIMKWLSCSN